MLDFVTMLGDKLGAPRNLFLAWCLSATAGGCAYDEDDDDVIGEGGNTCQNICSEARLDCAADCDDLDDACFAQCDSNFVECAGDCD